MRIGVLGCDAIRNELDVIIANDPEVVYKEYLEFGLHLRPDDLKRTILDKIKSLPVDVDVLFLGYAYCQSLKGLPEMVDIPLVMIEHEDCIAAMLTTERYHREKKNGGITWFYPAGWAVNGMPGIIRLFNLDCKNDEGYTPQYFLNMMFDGFSRCLFIDTGIACSEQCQKNSEHFARTLKLKHECTEGSLDLIQEAWLKAKSKASETKKDA